MTGIDKIFQQFPIISQIEVSGKQQHPLQTAVFVHKRVAAMYIVSAEGGITQMPQQQFSLKFCFMKTYFFQQIVQGISGCRFFYIVCSSPRLRGECSNTGVHGKNRLASNSLLEALVFSKRAAKEINRQAHEPTFVSVHGAAPEFKNGVAPLPSGIRTQIRDIMQKSHFVIPDQNAAEKGLKIIEQIRRRLDNDIFLKNADYEEAKSLATVAAIVLRGAINR